MMTDPIADMLTRVRNANRLFRPKVDVPFSQEKENILKKLKQEGFIKDYQTVEKPPEKIMTVFLKYGPDGELVIRHIERVSKPGRRVYKQCSELKKVLNGLGISIVSTSKGIMTDAECRCQKVGGEVLCTIY